MGDFIKGIFSEISDYSMMRVLSFICVFSACVLSFIKGDVTTIGLLLGAGITGKAFQKTKEEK